ncbi:VOC family protein [Streptomyces sp. NPDC001985]|uniref:VOC family protein n=1 Tax=Streptomyces sp. NPDC001985 TaxID=3154406 RepID=UPI003333C0AB
MALHWKLSIDAADPAAQADFWAEALGYEVEDPHTLIELLRQQGQLPEGSTLRHHDREAWRECAAVRHPDDPFDKVSGIGEGRRLLFQRVPEARTVENRVRLDLHPGPELREAEVTRLEALGATVIGRQQRPMGTWVVMIDPERNEFRVA